MRLRGRDGVVLHDHDLSVRSKYSCEGCSAKVQIADSAVTGLRGRSLAIVRYSKSNNFILMSGLDRKQIKDTE